MPHFSSMHKNFPNLLTNLILSNCVKKKNAVKILIYQVKIHKTISFCLIKICPLLRKEKGTKILKKRRLKMFILVH